MEYPALHVPEGGPGPGGGDAVVSTAEVLPKAGPAIGPTVETSPRPESALSDGYADSSLALLPRNTVVRIAGNNRTKASLVGLTAKVRRSIGLGGWHWLVLPSGEEIKLQRNALAVLEYPSGQEEESSASEGDRHKPATPLAAAHAPVAVAGGAVAPELGGPGARLPPKRPRPGTPGAGDAGDARRVSARQAAAAGGGDAPPHVNLGKLQGATLRRYLAAYSVPAAGPTHADLLEAAQRHFAAAEVTEEDVVRRFLLAAKRHAAGTGMTAASTPPN